MYIALQPISTENIKGRAIKVQLGGYHSMLLDDLGKIYITGNNPFGLLGLGDTVDRDVFTEIILPEGTKIKDIAVSEYTSYALDEEGNLWAWGYNQSGQVGDGTNIDVNFPKIVETDVKVIEVSFLGLSAYIIKNDGKLYSSGSDQYGQLGLDLGVNDRNVFTHVPFFDDKEIVDIRAGTSHVMVLTSEGDIYVAGYNLYGQLGIGNNINVEEFEQNMVIPAGKRAVRIFDSANTSFVELDDGQIWGCGRNQYGTLGFQSSYSVGGGSDLNKNFLTNIVTLEMVQ